MSEPEYIPPKVWAWEAPSGGQFASINRPTAGPTHDKELPVGKHPLQLYSLASPNGQKIGIMLEELLARGHAGAEYDAWLIHIGEGEQFSSGFVELNPNSKIPALMSTAAGPSRCTSSKAARSSSGWPRSSASSCPHPGPERAETLSWLFWQMGSAPFLGGGFGHFYVYAPQKFEYPINRYAMEAKRQLDVLDSGCRQRIYRRPELFDRRHRHLALVRAVGARHDLRQRENVFLATHEYPNLQRWAKAIGERPAVKRGRIVNKFVGDSTNSSTSATTAATSISARRTSWSG
jgi:GST-like protein